MKFDAVIFDLDGTLLDSMHIWDTLAEDYLKSIYVEPQNGLRDAVNTLMMEDAAEYLRNEYKLSLTTEQILEALNKIVDDFYFNKAELKDGVLEFLQFLSKKDIRMCIATASERYIAEAALKRCGILCYFEKIFICSEVGFDKSQPHIFNEALSFFDTQADRVLVFEDALFAAKVAKQAGFKVCGVFDISEKCAEELKNTADFYINSFKEAGVLID